jgi:membrane-bound serine protease (ClpP class)
MEFLISPNVAFVLIVAAIVLFMATLVNPKSTMLKVGMVLCLLAAGYELVHLRGNPWALVVLAFSPLPFFALTRQTRSHPALLVITILMLTVGSVFLFVDQNGRPLVNYLLAGGVSIICGEFVWITAGRKQNAEGARISDALDAMVGLTGNVRTEIEVHSTGSVEVEGEVWMARSKAPIPAGSTVRILRRDGAVLTVKKVETLTKE